MVAPGRMSRNGDRIRSVGRRFERLFATVGHEPASPIRYLAVHICYPRSACWPQWAHRPGPGLTPRHSSQNRLRRGPRFSQTSFGSSCPPSAERLLHVANPPPRVVGPPQSRHQSDPSATFLRVAIIVSSLIRLLHRRTKITSASAIGWLSARFTSTSR